MIEINDMINYIDNITIVPIGESLKYITTLKKGYVFVLTDTSVILTWNMEDTNYILKYGIRWKGK